MGVEFSVPGSWVSFKQEGVLIIGPPTAPGAKTGVRITLEAYHGNTSRSPAMDHYYRGPWSVLHSSYGLLIRVGTKISTLQESRHNILATEYADISSENLGFGISGFGSTVSTALAPGRKVLVTARQASHS